MAINRIRADIDLDAILYNMESMHNKLKPGTMMAAVVKADGYGHGAEAVSEVLEPLPYLWGYAVATSNEAMELIAAGRKKPILILGLSFPEQFEEIVDNDVRPAVCTYETAKELSRIAVAKNKTCKIHIKIDTGMCRIGFQVTEESADIIAQSEGSDPAAVIYDSIAACKARKADVLLCDTAGRLQNKKNLMEELRKIDRVIEREYSEAYRENLIVLDATTGQNALSQLREFNDVTNITGIILTKMDGTAKGGIAVAIQAEFGIPVKYIGVGEKVEDLQKFDSDTFVNALFDVDNGTDEV